MLKRIALATALFIPVCQFARAGDYFGLEASGTSGASVTASGSNLINLTNDLINQQGKFASLQGQGLTGTLTYGGVPNAIVFTENTAQTSATLTIPATGFTQTFTGTSSSDLQTQIKNFLKSNGAGAYAAFLKSINQTSTVAIVDGNPQAYTSFVAADAFSRFGTDSTLSDAPINKGGGDGEFRIDALGGVSRSSGFDGTYAELSLGSDIRFSNNVALSFGTALQYRDIGGSDSYFAAEEIGLPITLINRNHNGISWQVTPWGFGAIGASEDQVNGAVLVGGGGTSNLSLGVGDLTFTLGDQLAYESGIPVSFDGYSFDTDVNQWILTNGGKVTYNPGHGPFFVDASISYSNLLHHGAVPDYWTPSAGLGFYFGQASGIRLAYSGDFAHNYSDSGAKLTLFLAY